MRFASSGAALGRAINALTAISEKELQMLPLVERAFVLGSLPPLAELAILRQTLAQQLRYQLDPEWITTKNLEEVFSVLAALWRYDQAYVGGEALAAALQRLIHSEVMAGGPYRSQDMIQANVQIALFARAAAKPLPKVDAFLKEATAVPSMPHLADTGLSDPVMLYFLGKILNYHILPDHLMHQIKAGQTPQTTAVRLIIMKGKMPSAEARQAVQAIADTQLATGFWKAETLWKTVIHQRQQLSTTALILEALVSYRQRPAAAPGYIAKKQTKHRVVLQAAEDVFNGFTEPVRSTASAVINQICHRDKKCEITLISHFFAQALRLPSLLTEQQQATLGLANVCGWLAYTIYDDFLDDTGKPAYLPIANIAMRVSLHRFQTALSLDKNSFALYVERVFIAMDEANAWELNQARFAVKEGAATIIRLPAYGQRAMLAERSFGHALGPMAILAHNAILPGTSKAHWIELGFRHFLIARQLNDDMYDWLDDMKRGHATYVVAAILRDMRLKPGTHNLSALLPAMRVCFRKTVVPKVCRCILRHVRAAKRAFSQSQLLRPTNEIYNLLDALELSASRWLDAHDKLEALRRSLANSDYH